MIALVLHLFMAPCAFGWVDLYGVPWNPYPRDGLVCIETRHEHRLALKLDGSSQQGSWVGPAIYSHEPNDDGDVLAAVASARGAAVR